MAHLLTGGVRDVSFVLKKPLTDLWGSKTWGRVPGS